MLSTCLVNIVPCDSVSATCLVSVNATCQVAINDTW